MADDKPEQALEECKETVKELKVENEELRGAADTFGELAERLNQTLRKERSQKADPGHAAVQKGVPGSPR